jgi:hypothetical protein
MIIALYPMTFSPAFSKFISHAVSKAPINVTASDVTAPMHIPVGIDFDVPVTLLFLTMSSLPFRCNHISCRDKKEPGQEKPVPATNK